MTHIFWCLGFLLADHNTTATKHASCSRPARLDMFPASMLALSPSRSNYEIPCNNKSMQYLIQGIFQFHDIEMHVKILQCMDIKRNCAHISNRISVLNLHTLILGKCLLYLTHSSRTSAQDPDIPRFRALYKLHRATVESLALGKTYLDDGGQIPHHWVRPGAADGMGTNR